MSYQPKELTETVVTNTGKLVAQQLNQHQKQGMMQFVINNGIHITPIDSHKTLASMTIWDEQGFPIIAVNQQLNKMRQAWELIAQLNWLVSQELWTLPNNSQQNNVQMDKQLLYSRTIIAKETDTLINKAVIFSFIPNQKLDNLSKNKLAQSLSVLCNFNVVPLIKYQQSQF